MKPLWWVGRSLEDLRQFPSEVRRNIGFAFRFAQAGTKHLSAKPLKGFGGGGVLEIVENDDGNTYRAVYTVRFSEGVYVLHAFQKKSKSGSATPPKDMELIRRRLLVAEDAHRQFEESHGDE